MAARETGKSTYDFAVEVVERGIKARNAVCHQDLPNYETMSVHIKALPDLQHLLLVELRNDANLNRE